MKTVAAALAFAALAVAAPQASSTSFSPAEATLELFSALPSSIQAVAVTNEAEASTLIAEQFATGTPTWFTVLPSDVQSYFLAQQAPTVTSVPLTTGKSNSTASVTGKFSNSTTSGNSTTKSSSIALSSASLTTTSTAATSKASAASSSSTGAAAIPTAIIGGGLAGIVGLVGMLAL